MSDLFLSGNLRAVVRGLGTCKLALLGRNNKDRWCCVAMATSEGKESPEASEGIMEGVCVECPPLWSSGQSSWLLNGDVL
jgi:hypothetical protein